LYGNDPSDQSLVERSAVRFGARLTTSPMTYEDRIFEIEFDFIDHKLVIECSDGAVKILSLRPESVAIFTSE